MTGNRPYIVPFATFLLLAMNFILNNDQHQIPILDLNGTVVISSTSMSPFETLYGRKVKLPIELDTLT